jgi:hypothetical protein
MAVRIQAMVFWVIVPDLITKSSYGVAASVFICKFMEAATSYECAGKHLASQDTVIPRLTKIILFGITFVSRNVISRRFL